MTNTTTTEFTRNSDGVIEVVYGLRIKGGRVLGNRRIFLTTPEYTTWFDRFEDMVTYIRFCH